MPKVRDNLQPKIPARSGFFHSLAANDIYRWIAVLSAAIGVDFNSTAILNPVVNGLIWIRQRVIGTPEAIQGKKIGLFAAANDGSWILALNRATSSLSAPVRSRLLA